MNERLAIVENELDNLGTVLDDHETRLRGTEKRQYVFMGAMTVIQTVVLVLVQWYFNTKK